MERWTRIGMLTACVALAMGCDDRTEVQTRDLEQARENSGELTQGAGEPAASPAQSDAPRDELLPVKGADTDDATEDDTDDVSPAAATHPAAPEQPTSPVTDPRAVVPPPPPRLSPNSKVTPSDPPAPADPATRGMP